MSLRFISQLQVDSLPDEQLDNQFEVLMPSLYIIPPEADETDKNMLNIETGIFDVIENATKYVPVVEQIQFGVRNFKTDTRRIRTGWCNVPSDIENYNRVSITMFCSSNMLTQYYLSAWKRLIYNEQAECYNSMSFYKKEITVLFYGSSSLGVSASPSAVYHLVGCFPERTEDYKLKYSEDPARVTLTQTFCVDNVIIKSDAINYAIIAEYAASPTSLIDSAISTT